MPEDAFVHQHFPHIHALAADGLLDDDGIWHPAPEVPHRVLEELFRTKIFAELLRHKLISPELVVRMKSWKHTGFTWMPAEPSRPKTVLNASNSASTSYEILSRWRK